MIILYFSPTNYKFFILLNKYNIIIKNNNKYNNKKFINLKHYKLVKNKNYYFQ